MEAYLDRPYPPVLVLAGEPGIGKSRLLQEAALQAGARGYTVLLGGAHRRSGHEPYAPLLATLSRSLQGLPSSQTRTALIGCGWLTRLLPELVEIVSAPLPTGTLPAEQERRLVFAAVARYLANIGGPAGTLLVLDDLQWASPDGLDLLASLIHAESGQAVRALAAYRDTEVDQNPPLLALLSDLAEHHLVERFPLDPLEDVDAMALLDSLLPGRGEDEGARQRIVQRTGGVPFLLVSCVHELEAGTRETESRGPWPKAFGNGWQCCPKRRRRPCVARRSWEGSAGGPPSCTWFQLQRTRCWRGWMLRTGRVFCSLRVDRRIVSLTT